MQRPQIIVTVLTVLGALIIALQPLLGFFDPSFRGLLPYGGSEEGMYMLRTQHALLHPFTDASNGVWTGDDAPSGPQVPGLEETIGAFLFWTGVPAPWIVFFLTVLIAPLIIPLGVALNRRVGANWILSITAAVFYFGLIGFGRRYFHPGFSLPVVMGTLLLLWRWYEQPTIRRAVFAGLLLGFSTGVYLWAWTFLYAVAGLLCIALVADPSIQNKKAYLKTLPFAVLATALTGGPTLIRMFFVRLHPLFEETSVRIGLVHTRLPESVLRSVLTVMLAVVAFWIFRKSEHRKKFLPLLCIIAALAVMYNQQIVHGTVMSFSSHYIMYLYLAAILLITAVVSQRIFRWQGVLLIALCALPLIAAVPDHPKRYYAFMPPRPEFMLYQHLAPALKQLEGHQTVLTDRKSADIIASYTDHDVAFTEYAGFLLITDEEYAERACLSEIFAPQPIDYEGLVVHAEEKLKVIRGQQTEEKYQQKVHEANAVCDAVRSDPQMYMGKYGVTRILWNQKERPEWRIDETLFTQIAEGEGWALYRVRSNE